MKETVYDYKVKDIDGQDISMTDYKNKVLLIVNVASTCGFTPQYKGLQDLYEKYSKDGFEVLAFPCNQFGRQEPGSASDIREFCTRNYGVSFPMMAKVDVKGDEQHPVYAWLTQKELNGSGDHNVRWNFHKFLVNEQGELVAALGSGADPLGEEVLAFAEGR